MVRHLRVRHPWMDPPGPVLAFDATQRTNGARVADLAKLGYLPEPVLDPTYGYGGMWTIYKPKHLIAADQNKNLDVSVAADFWWLPFPDSTFGSVVFDPPYRLRGTATNQGGIDERYGTKKSRSIEFIHGDIIAGVAECARVVRSGGYLIVKCQAQVASGRVWWQNRIVAEEAERHGLVHVDELYLPSGRPQPGGRRQVHARRNYSTFVVLRKP